MKTSVTPDELFNYFTKTVTDVKNITDAADRFVFNAGHPFDVFTSRCGGAAYCEIRDRLLTLVAKNQFELESGLLPDVVERLVKHYHLECYKPRVSLTREAMALAVQLGKVIEHLHPDFHNVLYALMERTDRFNEPSDVFLKSFEEVAELAGEVVPE